MDQLDWTEGILLRQVRVTGVDAEVCGLSPLTGMCYGEPEAVGAAAAASDASAAPPPPPSPFGHNWTEPSARARAPWSYFSHEELGTNPKGSDSADMPSLRTFEGGGYVAAAIPFFSPVLLPEQRGTSAQILNFRRYKFRGGGHQTANGCNTADASSATEAATSSFIAEAGSGAASFDTSSFDAAAPVNQSFMSARGGFFCVRLTHNGVDLHQLCDPNAPHADPRGRTTGVVRAAVEEWWNDLRRGHFVDLSTRMVYMVLPLRNNNHGLRSRVKMMFETTSYGAVLPSYDMETRVEGKTRHVEMRLYSHVAFGFTCFFMVLEGAELATDGFSKYFAGHHHHLLLLLSCSPLIVSTSPVLASSPLPSHLLSSSLLTSSLPPFSPPLFLPSHLLSCLLSTGTCRTRGTSWTGSTLGCASSCGVRSTSSFGLSATAVRHGLACLPCLNAVLARMPCLLHASALADATRATPPPRKQVARRFATKSDTATIGV